MKSSANNRPAYAVSCASEDARAVTCETWSITTVHTDPTPASTVKHRQTAYTRSQGNKASGAEYASPHRQRRVRRERQPQHRDRSHYDMRTRGAGRRTTAGVLRAHRQAARFFQEQAISITARRFGNPDPSSQRSHLKRSVREPDP